MSERTVRMWTALAQLQAGAAPTLERLASASGRPMLQVERRLSKLERRNLCFLADARAREEQIERLMARAIFEIEAISGISLAGTTEEGGGRPSDRAGRATEMLDKGRMDSATALLRLIEKALDLNARTIRPQEAGQDDAEDLAETMRIIDERIVTLARAFAEDIAAGREVIAAE
ncbi:hypothetical protein [Limoniibacter endophyticus]|uniref:Uncharacterized protein n=1 Tax=Limoniibacter endophyticus TaxID=1565040 RepID=A0A8J3GFX5_9HYPH|nr:hypothetical protein [Limoniibacter endophyticus]GHC69392.1 hypothetical protein GCM10010136_15180 [Limoniibacter endophyticus]